MPGIFFFSLALAAARAAPLDLAAELFAEGQWAAARAESRRVPADAPEAARARLLAAVASLRAGTDTEPARQELAELWRADAADPATRHMAAYEWGRAEWAAGSRSNALAGLKAAYLETRDPALFWRAGCSLYFLLKSDKALRRQEAAVWRSLLSCRDAWPAEMWREYRPPRTAGPPLASLPGRWLVAFYRAQIGPALGARCDLQPSCSEYLLQASRAHGLLGIPLMADRFVREPSVVSAKERPVTLPDGRIRFADPVSDHDAWLRGKQ